MIAERPDRPPRSRHLEAAVVLDVPRWVLVGVFLLHILPFAARPTLIGGDEPHFALMAHSLAVDRDVDLADDYQEVTEGSAAAGRRRVGQALDRHVIVRDGREIFAHPLGLPALAAPLLWLQQLAAPGAPPDPVLGLLTLAVTFCALLAGCRMLGGVLGSSRRGAIVGLALYFGTPLWYYSRTFFTEPYLWSWTLLAIFALARGWLVAAAGALALALAMKETAVLLVVPVLLASWRAVGLRAAAVLACGPLLLGVAWSWKNIWLVGEPFVTYQPFRYGNLGAGLVGLLLDSSRGVLWFAPLCLVGLVAWVRRPPSGAAGWIWLAGLLAFASWLVACAAWIEWRGGSSYGTRLLLPVLPATALPLARLWRDLEASGPSRLPWLVLGLPFSLGFAVNLTAAVDPVPAFWGPTIAAQVGGQPVAFAVGLAGAGFFSWRVLAARGGAPAPSGPASATRRP
jgi:hypothetical protein